MTKSLEFFSLSSQLTTCENLTPGDHVLQVMNETEDDLLHYKPSTPIGEQRSIVNRVEKQDQRSTGRRDGC